jgi:signal transduction histidine kinase
MVITAVLAVALMFFAPFDNGLSYYVWWSTPGRLVLLIVPLVGGLLLAMAHYANSLAGIHAMLAEPLLGPSPAERLAGLARSYGKIAERNRITGELHDSVGHDLTLIVVQADAAHEVFEDNPEFARQALASIKEIGREALGGLDRMLGVLRDEPEGRDEGRDLKDLEGFLDRMRLVGLPVSASVSGDHASVPGQLGREAYRIVQEGCTNVLKHAGRVPTRVSVTVDRESLEVAILNESPGMASAAGGSSVGRRGLRGIAERVDALGGFLVVGPASEGGYVLRARLPLQAANE